MPGKPVRDGVIKGRVTSPKPRPALLSSAVRSVFLGGGGLALWSGAAFSVNYQNVELKDISAPFGFHLVAESDKYQTGRSVSRAGDINGDGVDDIVIGAPESRGIGKYRGATYVIFGKNVTETNRFRTRLELSSLDGTNGFKVNGENVDDFFGPRVSDAGDINHDGIDDLAIGAWDASDNGEYSGAVYILFGKDTTTSGHFPAEFDLSTLDGTNGFQLNGDADDSVPSSVSAAGDINGDGVDDLLLGASSVASNGYNSGAAYVVFGKNTNVTDHFPASMDLSSLDGTNGFRLNGEAKFDDAGESVSGTGDINGDGIDDLIVLAPDASPTGRAYVVFGKDTAVTSHFPKEMELASLDGTEGFQILGEEADDFIWGSVSGAGDLNRDGIGDVLLGAPRSDANGSESGAAYVVYGKNTSVTGNYPAELQLSSLDSVDGFRINGESAGDGCGGTVARAGDINNDGIDDILIGAPSAGKFSGAAYVVFGRDAVVDGNFPAELELSFLGRLGGFRINGEQIGDQVTVGDGLSGAGDINGDGADDVVMGAWDAFRNRKETGVVHVVFGGDTDGDSLVDVLDLDNENDGTPDRPLPRGVLDRSVFGNGYGSNMNPKALKAKFNWDREGDVLLHVGGIDIDTNAEVAFSVNGTLRGHLRKGRSRRSTPDSVIWLRPEHLEKGINTIEFENTLNDKWGLARLGVLDPGAVFGNVQKHRKLRDTLHKKGLDVHLLGSKAKLLVLKGWDANRTKNGRGEIEFRLDGKVLGQMPTGLGSRFTRKYHLYLPGNTLDEHNILTIRNRIKNGTEWGVRLQDLVGGRSSAGSIDDALKGTSKKVHYLVPVSRNAPALFLTRYFDVDKATEIAVYTDGRFGKFAPVSADGEWVKDRFRISPTGARRLAWMKARTTENGNEWGVQIRGWRNVLR